MKLFNIASLGVSLGTLGLFSFFSQAARAADYIGNKGVQFDQDTTIEFEFIVSHGAYQSTFGVIDLDSCQTTPNQTIIVDSCDKTPLIREVQPSDNQESVLRPSNYQEDLYNSSTSDFIGTPGNTVIEPLAEFTFEAGRMYVFYLESRFDNKFAGIVYSTDLINPQSNRQALFDDESISTREVANRSNTLTDDVNQFDALLNGGILLRFDDTGSRLVKAKNRDHDYDDFVVGIGGYEGCIYDQSQNY
ncbi:MAG: hypothetical protein QNJ60_02945 [Xenococcaceae cyanobacterium MO_188.B19]|nr:hypothetical protein [Xenococcaceae cyanobacterium MO_188.B19]